jgi:hypothetical protein
MKKTLTTTLIIIGCLNAYTFANVGGNDCGIISGDKQNTIIKDYE